MSTDSIDRDPEPQTMREVELWKRIHDERTDNECVVEYAASLLAEHEGEEFVPHTCDGDRWIERALEGFRAYAAKHYSPKADSDA